MFWGNMKESLPARRQSMIQKIVIPLSEQDHVSFYMNMGYVIVDGKPVLKEVFFDMKHKDELSQGLLNALARCISIGLQNGVPVEHYVKTLAFMRFPPCGCIQGHHVIKHCSSIVDYIAREIGVTFCQRTDLQHVKK